MSKQRNPQAEQMADESMLRNLTAQAEAIWPQEYLLLERYGQPARIADIGCGSGEITGRLAARYPQAQIVGVDILESSAAYARQRYASLAPRVRFERGDAFELRFPNDEFDLVACRHMTQSVPDPDKVIAELCRICKPGGWIHVLSEDYGMLHMPSGAVDPDRLWHEGVFVYTQRTHTDARIGRRTWAIMNGLGLHDLRVDYVVVDTLRVPRPTFATIMEAWRDGYSDVLAEHSKLTPSEIRALFDQIIATILDPQQYAVWHIPVISGRKRT
jgi:ubiquinone/menaquinone biosynthesis C-methylase UbiE